MHTIKMIAPLSGMVTDCNADAVQYLEKAGWKHAPSPQVTAWASREPSQMEKGNMLADHINGDRAYRRIIK